MRTIPYDTSGVVLLCATDPKPRIKNFKTGEVDTDRETGAPLVTIDLVITFDGRAEIVSVMVPQPGIGEAVRAGVPVRATGLVYRAGEKNGRTWELFTARALTPLASEPSR